MFGSCTASTRQRFKRSKPNAQGGGKGEYDTPPRAVTALLGEEQSQRYSAGYLTIRDDKSNIVSFAYGVEVYRKAEWGVPLEKQTPEPPRRSVSVRRLHQVKQSISESTNPFVHRVRQSISETTRPIVAAIEERVTIPITIKRQLSTQSKKGKAKREELDPVVHEHNPRVVFGKPSSKLETMMEKSKTLSSIVSSVKCFNFRQRPQVPPNRDWDRRGDEHVLIPDWKRDDVSQWTEAQIAQYDEQQLVALTPRQLKELQGKSIDCIVYAHPIYMVPPPTPCGSDSCSIQGDDDEGEGDVFGRPNDNDTKAEHNYLHKDLRKMFGPHTGFHITPDSGDEKTFFEHSNRSSYYNEPLVELGHDPNAELISFVNMVDKEFQRADGLYENEEDDSDTSSKHGRAQFQCPRSQLPGQALMYYLLFKGLPIRRVAEMLGTLDKKFLYEHGSRWWNGYRIPQHTQLNDAIVDKALEVAKGEKQWWEAGVDEDGNEMPDAQMKIHSRQRERNVVRFAKQSVENYLWWRLKGEQPHRSVKSGAMLRKGEY